MTSDVHRPAVSWEVHPPPAGIPAWLDQVRRFRAEVLHAGGLRPAFRGPDGRFYDDDPADDRAHHVVATVEGRPVAALRVVPLALTHDGFCERLLGTAALAAFLDRIEAERATTWEGSGWAVHPGHRSGAMGATVLAAGQAVARDLGLDVAIGAAGSRYGQLHRILTAGYRRAPGVEPIDVPALADEVHIVHGSLDSLRPTFRSHVEHVADLLRSERRSPTRVNRMTS